MLKMYFFIKKKTNFVENWCFKHEIWESVIWEIKREIWEIKREIWEIKREIWEINVDVY